MTVKNFSPPKQSRSPVHALYLLLQKGFILLDKSQANKSFTNCYKDDPKVLQTLWYTQLIHVNALLSQWRWDTPQVYIFLSVQKEFLG